jgi:CPA2 family monovalent cation:H+ antiporter-2
VITISDPVAARHVVALAREVNPDVLIIGRTRYLSEAPELERLGATQVIP